MKRTFRCTAASLLLATAASAQTPAATGHWQASIQANPTTELTTYFDLEGTAPALTGAMSVPQQTPKPFPLSSIIVRHDSLLLAVEALRGSFAGRFSADGQQVAGAWVQNGKTFPLTLRRRST